MLTSNLLEKYLYIAENFPCCCGDLVLQELIKRFSLFQSISRKLYLVLV